MFISTNLFRCRYFDVFIYFVFIVFLFYCTCTLIRILFGKRFVWLSLSNLGISTHSFLCWNVSICCDYVDWTKRFAFVTEFFSMFIIFFNYLSCIYQLIYLYVGILTCLYISDFIVQCLLFSVYLIRRFVLTV